MLLRLSPLLLPLLGLVSCGGKTANHEYLPNPILHF